jgi:ribonuclease VapC
MGLNIKNTEVERLAAEVAKLAGESKTEAIRQSLLERKEKLQAEQGNRKTLPESMEEFWATLPPDVPGKPLTKAEEEEILGFGSEGMILDTSAVVAIVGDEQAAGELMARIESSRSVGIGVPNLLEAMIVLYSRLGARAAAEGLNRFRRDGHVHVIPFTVEHSAGAIEAYMQYGKGRHPAGLYFGDCMAYAVAKAANQPLLYTGADFSTTDIARA